MGMTFKHIDGYLIELDPDQEFMWKEAGYWLKSQDLGGLVGLDIGTHHAYFALQAIKLGAKKVYGVEACFENYSRAHNNVSRNQLDNKIILTHQAVSNVDGQLVYVRRIGGNDGQCGIKYREHHGLKGSVTTISLQTLIDKINVEDNIDFIKIDVEGAEWDIFNSGQYDGLRYRLKQVKLLEIECHKLGDYPHDYNCIWDDDQLTNLQDFIKSCGFQTQMGGVHGYHLCAWRE